MNPKRFALAFALSLTGLSLLAPAAKASDAAAEPPYPAGASTPQIANFLGADGFGAPHPTAPAGLASLGRLAGLWDAVPEMRVQDGSWVEQTPALWAWQYTLGGFALQDLWFHSADRLPSYLAALGRDYQLTGLRLYEAASGSWRVAWAANGGGGAPGMDFGLLEGKVEGDDVVLRSQSEYGHQRITFSEITDRTFRWTSEMSRDGETWMTVMRVRATRRD